MRDNWRIAALVASVALLGLLATLAPRLPQDPAYHAFAADGVPGSPGSLGPIPNWQNVLSNIPFVLIGLQGLLTWRRQRRLGIDPPERRAWLCLFVGIALTGFGSAYYHWAPSNGTLLWDRLPMTVAFMSLLAALLGERLGFLVYKRLFGPLVAAGLLSVLYWSYTELRGAGDLRPYAFVQYGSLVAVLLTTLLFRPRWSHGAMIFAALGLYLLAKSLEVLDRPIHDLLGVGGHALKHFAAAGTCLLLVLMYERRQPSGEFATLEFDR